MEKWISEFGEDEVEFYLDIKTGLCGWRYITGSNASVELLKNATKKEVENYFEQQIWRVIRGIHSSFN